MAYGTVKVDNITFDNGGSDQNVTVSGLYNSLTSGVSVTGTISGSVVIGSTSVSGTTVLGTTVSGTTVQGVSGTFTSLTGTTTSGTTANFVSGVFTTRVSGTTVTGTTSSFTSGNFTSLSGTTATFTSGIFASGTAAAPSVSVGTASNGIYSPGADQVAVATNGTGRLFVDASGNVGINTTPSSLGTSVTTLEVKGGSTTRSGGLRVSSSDSSVKGAFYIYDGAGVLGTESATPLDLYTGNSPRLRITDAGLVGIGTSSPSFTAHVSGAKNTSQLFVAAPTISAANDFAQIGFGLSSSAFGAIRLGFDNPAGASNSYLSFFNDNGSGLQERLRIDSSGNVGIGTTSPSTTLTVNGNIGSNGRGTSFGYTLPDWRIYNSSSGNALVIDNYTTEALRVDSANRLLVGTSSARNNFYNTTTTTSPSLQLEGTTYSQSSLSLVNNNTSTVGGFPMLIMAKSAGSSVGSNTAVSDGHVLGQFTFQGNDGSEFVVGATISAVVDGTSGANDLPTRLEFSTTADGASSPTERMRISQNGVVSFYSGGSVRTQINSNAIYDPANNVGIVFGSLSVIATDGNGSVTDNSRNLGAAANRWGIVYAGTGTINTSDANLKQDIEDLEQAELKVAATIKGLIKKFRFIDAVSEKGNDARIHVGVIAQEVEQAFIDEGLEPRRYGMFCEDTLEDGSNRFGIRYDELLAFVIAAL